MTCNVLTGDMHSSEDAILRRTLGDEIEPCIPDDSHLADGARNLR